MYNFTDMMHKVKKRLLKISGEIMNSIGYCRDWHGSFSEVKNYIAEKYPNILFEHTTFGFGIIFNIPEEYVMSEVSKYVLDKFEERYHVCTFGDNARLIIVTV